MDLDDFKLYDGDDYYITDKIIVTQPTLRQIKEFGEQDYWNAVHTLTSVGADMKWQLWDTYGIDYTTIGDYDLFIKLTSYMVSSRKKMYMEIMSNPEKYKDELESSTEKDLVDLLKNPLQLVLKDLDFADFIPCAYEDDESQLILVNEEKEIIIDAQTFVSIVSVVRKIHGLKRNNRLPGNEATKQILIDEAREEAMMNADKPYHSILRPMVSALTVWTGQKHEEIMNMKICRFLDNVRRVDKIRDAEHLMTGAYSGFASLKGVDKERLNWSGELK